MTHGDDNSLSTCSCDPVSAIGFSIAKLFLLRVHEFSRASDGGPATTKTKWRHGEERYHSEVAKERRHLMGDRHTKGGQK